MTLPGEMLRAALVAFIIALAVVTTACSTAAEPPPAPDPTATLEGTPFPRLIIIPMGRTASTDTTEITIHGERTSDHEAGETPPDGFEWRLLELTVKNTGDQAFALYAELTHADGRAFKRVAAPVTSPGLDEDIGPGEEVSGEVAFLIEAGTLGGILIYGPGEPRWALELGMPRQQ